MDEEKTGEFHEFYKGSASDIEKKRLIALSFQCTDHRARSYKNKEEKHAFITKTEDLMYRFLRFTPSDLRNELEKHYKELDAKLNKIEETNLDPQQKEREKLDTKYEHALRVHRHNMKIIPYTTVIDHEVEGELDITNEETLEVIRGGGRQDATKARIVHTK